MKLNLKRNYTLLNENMSIHIFSIYYESFLFDKDHLNLTFVFVLPFFHSFRSHSLYTHIFDCCIQYYLYSVPSKIWFLKN